MKIHKFKTCLGIFGLEIEKYIAIFEISTLEFFKSLNLGPNNALFVVFRQQFRKTIVIFGISTYKFVLFQSLEQK